MRFVNELHNVAKDCDFDNTSVETIYNQNVRDQLFLGLKSNDLLAESSMTLDTAVCIAGAYEASVRRLGTLIRNIKTFQL